MVVYQDAFQQLADLGILDVILPFILIFTIVFAVLQKVKIFGDGTKSKPFNVVISLVMGAAVIFPHVLGYYPPEKDIVNIINTSLPNVSVVIVAIVMALIIIGVLGRRFEIGDGTLSGWIALAAFVLIAYIFGDAASWWDSPQWAWFLRDSQTMTLIITILVFAIIIWFITKEDKEKPPEHTFAGQLGKMLQAPDKK
jgi:hypothetical protein